jgi:hypothetical protein
MPSDRSDSMKLGAFVALRLRSNVVLTMLVLQFKGCESDMSVHRITNSERQARVVLRTGVGAFLSRDGGVW